MVHKDSSIDFSISVLGNGSSIIAQDTLPFAIWCIAQVICLNFKCERCRLLSNISWHIHIYD